MLADVSRELDGWLKKLIKVRSPGDDAESGFLTERYRSCHSGFTLHSLSHMFVCRFTLCQCHPQLIATHLALHVRPMC